MMKSTTILLGDSLACPRPWEEIYLYDTYGCQVQTLLGPGHYVFNWSKGENSTKKVLAESFLRTYVRAAKADYAIIQLGIVDCAPRLMSNFERIIGGIATRLPFFREVFKSYADLKARHRYQLTKLFPMSLVPQDKFYENYNLLIAEILAWNNIKQIFLINIAYPGEILIKRSYGIIQNIQAYNRIIAELHEKYKGSTHLIDFYSKTLDNPQWITVSDGHHILKPAHDWLAKTIATLIEKDQKTITPFENTLAREES